MEFDPNNNQNNNGDPSKRGFNGRRIITLLVWALILVVLIFMVTN